MRDYLDSGAPVFIHINPVEYHGPHLSLHMDALASQGFAKDLFTLLKSKNPTWDYLEMAPIEFGVDPTPGPGSQKSSFKEVRSAVLHMANTLIEIGAKKVIWMSFHGAPAHNAAIQAGVDRLSKAGIPSFNFMNVILDIMVTYDVSEIIPRMPHTSDSELKLFLAKNMSTDFHGGFFETSIALCYAPQSVSKNFKSVPDCPEFKIPWIGRIAIELARKMKSHRFERELFFGLQAIAWSKLRPFPGYTGTPRHADASTGRELANLILERAESMAVTVFERKLSPVRPILEWTVPVSRFLFG